ncbi:MAG: Mur ligase family protein, partial [Patescibacteria group bacterium]
MSLGRAYQQLKNVYHFFQAHFWRAWYGWPERGMEFYGVTGTNGKTTTSIVLGNILRAAHGAEKVGLLATIVFWIGDKEVVNETKMTTMDSRDVFRYLKEMRGYGMEHVVLEMTSH